MVITRNIDEVLVIDNRIEVMVCGIFGGQVKLGIKAPREIPIHRREIQDLINAKMLDAEAADKAFEGYEPESGRSDC